MHAVRQHNTVTRHHASLHLLVFTAAHYLLDVWKSIVPDIFLLFFYFRYLEKAKSPYKKKIKQVQVLLFPPKKTITQKKLVPDRRKGKIFLKIGKKEGKK